MPHVAQFDADLRDSGRSVAMRRKVLTSLKSIISYAQLRGKASQNVARGVKVKADTRSTEAPLKAGRDFPTKGELKLLIDHAPPQWRALIVTAIFTGMRVSELRGLRWQDVDLAKQEINVSQRADNWQKVGNTKSKAGKREIPLPPIVVNALAQWRPQCPGELVFPGPNGEIEKYFRIRRYCFNPLQVAAGVTVDGQPKYSFHSLRHAAANLFIAHLGWTPKRVQAVMGHGSIQMTFDRYGHLFDDRDNDREAMKKLQAAVIAA
jgi:integrase